MSASLPSAFLGHGSPMHALGEDAVTRAWAEFGRTVQPRAVLVVSAHWCTRGTAATAMAQPRTIHDFHGFPRELYAVRYPAPGSPELARRALARLRDHAGGRVAEDHGFGLDHGAWSVLLHVFPEASIPVVQVSLDLAQPMEWHLEAGRLLRPLRDEGVLVLGSGNVVHNLGDLDPDEGAPMPAAGRRFRDHVEQVLAAGDDAALAAWRSHPDAAYAAPTVEHFLPLLWVAGARRPGEPLRVLADGPAHRGISMFSCAFG